MMTLHSQRLVTARWKVLVGFSIAAQLRDPPRRTWFAEVLPRLSFSNGGMGSAQMDAPPVRRIPSPCSLAFALPRKSWASAEGR